MMSGREDQTEGKGWLGSALLSRMDLNTSKRVMAAGGGGGGGGQGGGGRARSARAQEVCQRSVASQAWRHGVGRPRGAASQTTRRVVYTAGPWNTLQQLVDAQQLQHMYVQPTRCVVQQALHLRAASPAAPGRRLQQAGQGR